MTVVLKVEIVNPIRSFKGRGTEYLLHCVGAEAAHIVCASAGNFGQGVAYSARKLNKQVTVFAATNANPQKVKRMRALGAEVVLEGEDFDASKEAARAFAESTGALFLEDGRHEPSMEGAGTIALELSRMEDQLDAVLIPLGDGALASGIGLWLKRASPRTKVVGVSAEGAPAMEVSFRSGKATSTAKVSTIADGIAVRVPIPEAVHDVREYLDEVVLVSDDEIIESMRLLHSDAGLVVEPAGAAGLAAASRFRSRFAGQRVGIIVTGGNMTKDQIRGWLLTEPGIHLE